VGGLLGHALFLKSRKVAFSPQNSSPSLKALKISLAASQKAEGEDDEAEGVP
jgi:hypothetical protein